MLKYRATHYLIKALEAHNVKYVFGLPGHGNMNILDAIYDSTKIEFKLVRHEQSAVHIADGYARISNDVGVCCSSVGPGAANMIMGLATSNFSSSPVLAIFGGIISKQTGRGQLQETSRSELNKDQIFTDSLHPFTKKVFDINHVERTGEIIRKAFSIAKGDRPGSVAIEFPWDLQSEFIENIEIQKPKDYAFSKTCADYRSIKEAANLLLSSKCPVIIAGNGSLIDDASNEILQLAEIIGAPIATSFVAKGVIPEDNPLSIGMVGWLGHPLSHEIIREHADYIFAIGYRFSDQATSWWTEGRPYVKENKFIQLDIQQQELGKNYPIEIGLLGNAKETLVQLNNYLIEKGGRNNCINSIKWISDIKSKFKLELPDADKTPMESMVISNLLRKLLPRDSILSVDTGIHAHYFSAFYPIYGPRLFLNPGGWTPMGWGPTAIIGAKLAEPDKVCVSITGDGGFLMVCQEILTAVEWNIPILWFIFNDMALRAIREGQKQSYSNRIIGTEFTQNTNFADMARSMGALGFTVKRTKQLNKVVDQAISSNKPCVIDLYVDRNAVYPPLAGSWYEPSRSKDSSLPRGSKREWT